MKTSFIQLKKLSILLVGLFIHLFVFAQVPPSDLDGETLKDWLVQNYYTGKHNQLGYSSARAKMYNYIDNKNNTITCVYSGYIVNSNYGGTTTYPAPINCEHTIPQSFFNSSEPMKSDIHHLYPTYENWNSTRSNYPFDEIDDHETDKWMRSNTSQTTIPTSNIDEYSEYANSTFEPREDHKGNCARSIFYFYTMYPSQAGSITKVADLDVLYQWHLDDPVDEAELDRNDGVEQYQGNRNPYIDYPELVARAYGFETGEAGVPPAAVIQLAASASSITISWSNLSNETGYNLYKSLDGNNYNLLVNLAQNTTSYEDFDVVESSTYYYYLSAYNDEGNSLNSNEVSGMLQSAGGGTDPGDVASDELFISQYIEGTSYNKAIEITNFTGSDVDLSNYSLQLASNGNGWGNTLNLAGTLAHGQTYVVAHKNAASAILNIADLIEPTSSVINFNGDDAIGLFKSGSLIDLLGEVGSTAQFGKDVVLVRKESIYRPNTVYDANEWDIYDKADFSKLGSHTILSTSLIKRATVTKLNGFNVSLFPNPAASTLNIEIASDKLFEDVSVSLYNLQGKIVRSEFSGSTNSNSTLRWNVSTIPAGIYFVKVESNGEVGTSKVIIQ